MNWKIQAAFGSAILTLLVMAGISIESRSAALSSQRWIQHTYEVLACLQQMEEQLSLARSDEQSYSASGNPDSLNAFHEDLTRSRILLQLARGLTMDNMVQQRRLNALEVQIEQEQLKVDALKIPPGQQHPQMHFGIEGIGALTDKLQGEELRLLKVRTDENGRRMQRSAPTQWIRLFVGLTITLIAAWAVKRETTRRSKAELALRQGEQRIRGLLQSAPDPWIVLDPDGNILLINTQAEAQFGYSQSELLGLRIEALLPHGLTMLDSLDDRNSPSPEDPVTPAHSGAGNTVEVLGKRKDGSQFAAEMTLSSIETSDGVLTSAALRDIEERRKSERHLEQVRLELQRSNEELQRFAYVTSHDLQEPLRMVASYVQLLARRYRGQLDSDADEFIGYAVDGCVRMKQLIQDLLAYSRAGAEERSLKEISMEAVVDHALANLRSAIKESCAVITRDPLPVLSGDQTQLVQIFQNLIGNAIKYRRASALCIHISARRENADEWIFSVKDNGRGIEPAYFEKIFVIFQRLQADKGADGTGIGLAICKRMIEKCGGRIWVESEPEVGSTFYFTLPSQPGGSVRGTDLVNGNREILQGEPVLQALPQEQWLRPWP
jgi:PAS domain S-box-containing protein